MKLIKPDALTLNRSPELEVPYLGRRAPPKVRPLRQVLCCCSFAVCRRTEKRLRPPNHPGIPHQVAVMVTTGRFKVPPGNIARVRIIDTTTCIKALETHHVMGPPMPGMYTMPELPAWSFLVESTSGRKALFDLGVPPNWQDFSPWVMDLVHSDGWGWQISSQIHVADILKAGGVDPALITDIVWR